MLLRKRQPRHRGASSQSKQILPRGHDICVVRLNFQIRAVILLAGVGVHYLDANGALTNCAQA